MYVCSHDTQWFPKDNYEIDMFVLVVLLSENAYSVVL